MPNYYILKQETQIAYCHDLTQTTTKYNVCPLPIPQWDGKDNQKE